MKYFIDIIKLIALKKLLFKQIIVKKQIDIILKKIL